MKTEKVEIEPWKGSGMLKDRPIWVVCKDSSKNAICNIAIIDYATRELGMDMAEKIKKVLES